MEKCFVQGFPQQIKGGEIIRLITKSLLPLEKTDAYLMNGLDEADTPLLVHGNGQHATYKGFIAKTTACGPLNYGTVKPLYSTRASLIMLRP